MADTFGWSDFATGTLLDCVDSVEYAALAEAAKDGLRIIISAGAINFVDGSPMWNALHAIFPDGTTTWAAMLSASLRGKAKP